MASLNDRIRRLEQTRKARASSHAQRGDLERLCLATEFVRDHGKDVPLPQHLVASDIEGETRTLEWFRDSGGWESEESRAFLEQWERAIHDA